MMKQNKWIWLAIILLPLAVFWQTRSFDFVWDDEVNVSANPYLNPVTSQNLIHFWREPYERLYIPMSYTIWAVIAPFARVGQGKGLDPALFHTANVLLHILSAVALFGILKIAVRNEWAAGAGALLFALHPVQVEAVAWVTGLKDLLAGCLSLVSIWQYLHFALPAPAKPVKRKNSKRSNAPAIGPEIKLKKALHYGVASLAYLFALLAKPSAIVTPLIAGLLDLFVLRRSFRQTAQALAGWILIAVLFVVVSTVVQPNSELEFVTPLWERPLVAADALAFYLYKLAIPLWLSPDYGRLPELVLGEKWIYFSWLVPSALAAFVWLARKRTPYLVAGVAIFVVGILPVSGLAPFNFQNVSTVADRYLYLSMAGPSLALAWFLSVHFNRRTVVVCSLVLVLLGIKSAWQTGYWRDDAALFTHMVNLNPRSWTGYYNLGRALAAREQDDQAIAAFREAVRLQPEFTNAYFSLGGLLVNRGDFAGASGQYRRALEITPEFVEARLGLANALARAGNIDAAMAALRDGIKLDPGRADLHFNLGNLLVTRGELAEAIGQFEQAIAIRPNFAAAHNNLGRLIASRGDLAGAEKHFREALQIAPDFAEAHESLALALAQQGKMQEAEWHAREAQRLKDSRAAPVR
ncbi:MAG: tetratricopeptide repeat protein [Alphaproteobacteria bacterium]